MRVLVLALTLAALGLAAAPARAAPAARACAELKGLTIPDTEIVSATEVAAGPFTPPAGEGAARSLAVPAFCRVVAVARPTPRSSITIEVWVPPAAAWNGKFLGLGANGFQGVVAYPAMAEALRRGYAAAATDTGHVGGELAFAIGEPEKAIDWAYRSTHLAAVFGKLVVRDHYGRWPQHSYFQGCDTGGHQALMEAQRYPDDYDGVVAGNPAANRLNEIIGYLGVWKATRDAEGKSLLPAETLQFVTRAAVAECDPTDGVKDGVIDDPRTCRFDPASLACAPGASSACLTPAQVAAVRAVYAGVRHAGTGELIFAGWPVGSEGFGPGGGGWGSMVNGPAPRRSEFFNNFVFDDPAWDWRSFDFDKDVDFAREKAGYVSAVDPDLSPFKARGGKLLMYTGWVDPILPAYDIIDYYGAVARAMGGPLATRDFFRFFLAPGMAHCNGGPGPNVVDMLPALEAWVERGVAPERVVATRPAGDPVQRSRPLCAYPLVARWSGRGDTDEAANFACVAASPR
jgi:feruloyl esterase